MLPEHPSAPDPAGRPGPDTLAAMIGDLADFVDDGGLSLQRIVARAPLLLDASRAYIARRSADGTRFSVTQSSNGDGPDLLGHTQSLSRLPAFARGALAQGVQATIEDGATFPFTPQQRKMLWYAGLGASVFSPILVDGKPAGAFVLDALAAKRAWTKATVDACRTLADALGVRLALARNGDHLGSGALDHAPAAQLANVLAKVARLLERPAAPAETSVAVVDELATLAWIAEARITAPDEDSALTRAALAAESLVVRAHAGITRVGIPLLHEGERFGALELELKADTLSNAEEQFLRTVQVFAGNAYAHAVRRARPRDEALRDGLTGLLSYRSINECLAEAVHAAKSSGRPVAAWLVDVDGLDAINQAHGYATGDDLVAFVGHALREAVAPRGQAGRVGGGVFLVVLEGVDGDEAQTWARMAVERVARAVPGHLPAAGLTAGVSVFPAQAAGHDDLVRSARLALYAAKKNGPNSVALARVRDDRWMHDAHAAFVRAVSAQQLPAMRTR